MLTPPTQSHIVLGSVDNDHTGEGLREGGVKIDADLTALFDEVGYSRAALSRFTGIDATGATPCNSAIQTAINFCAANSIELYWDCPAYISCAVNYNAAVFVPSFTKITFGPQGVLNCDSMLSPVLVFANVHDWRITNFTLNYIINGTTGAFGDFAMTTVGPNAGAFNDQALKSYLISNNGNTFNSGGSSKWGGPAPGGGLIFITGNSYRGYFTGKGRISIADSAIASQYIPCICSLTRNWNTGLTNITAATVPGPSNTTAPYEIYFEGLEVDGYWMGWVGSPTFVYFKDIVAKRYADYQDSNGFNVGGPPSAPNLFAPPHLFYLQSEGMGPCRTVYRGIDDLGYFGGTNRRTTGSGFINSIKFEPGAGSSIQGYRCYRPHGFSDLISHGYALGEATGIHVEMDTSAGCSVQATASAPIAQSATSTALNFPWSWGTGSYQATFSNGDVRTITAALNGPTVNWTGGLSSACTASFTVAAVNQANFAARHPSASSMTNVTVDMDVIDTATVPAGCPILSDNGTAHTNIHFGCRITQNDYPGGYQPGFVICGTGNIVKQKMILAACTATQASQGALWVQGASSLNNCHHELEIVGWRLFNASNLTSFRQRVTLQGTTGAASSNGNRGRVMDVTNGWELIWDNGIAREYWTQRQVVTPAPGATYNTAIAWPANFSADCVGWEPIVNFVGPTTVGVGWASSPNALITGAAVTVSSDSSSPGAAPLSMGSQTIMLTANGSNFTGTGQAILVVRGIRNAIGG